jgi:hypothetical protein
MFPDGNGILDSINKVLAGLEGWGPVNRTDTDPHGEITGLEGAGPVDGPCIDYVKALQGLSQNTFALFQGQGLVSLIVQGCDTLAKVMIPHPTLEGTETAGAKAG